MRHWASRFHKSCSQLVIIIIIIVIINTIITIIYIITIIIIIINSMLLIDKLGTVNYYITYKPYLKSAVPQNTGFLIAAYVFLMKCM